jgi:hypothetical protein
VLRVVDVDAAADGCGDGREIVFVGADDEVRPGVVESFGYASGQKPGELRLAGGASPALGYHRGGDCRYDAAE